MKTLLKFIGFLILLAVIGIGAAIFMLPKDRIKAEVQTAFKNETGRDLNFGDDVGLSFYPDLGIVLNDVTLSNASWSNQALMARIGKADVLLELKPLLQRHIVVKRFILNQPEILLEVNEQNEGNWEFVSEKKAEEEQGADATNAVTSQSGDNTTAAKLKLSKVEIVDGRLRYVNHMKKVDEEISDVDLEIDAPDLRGQAEIDGDMTYKGQEIELDADLSDLGALTAGDATPANIMIESDVADLAFKGKYDPKEKYLMEGALNVDMRSLSDFLKLIGFKGRQGVMPYNSFVLKMDGKAGLQDMDFENLNFTADDLVITGKGRVVLSGAKPFYGGTYNINVLDVNKFLGAAKKAEGKKVDTATTHDQKANKLTKPGKGWDKTPIDYAFMDAFNLNIIANVDKYLYDGLEFGANTLQLEIKNKVLEMNMSDTPAFGGTINHTTILEADINPPTIRTNSKIKNMNANDVFKYFADYDKLSGKMNATLFNVTAEAKSIASIASTLAGTVDVRFEDGEIRGIDMVNWAKSFQKRLANIDTNYGSTEFVSMNSNFLIANGMARNNVFSMKGPLANATAKGDLNIADKTLDYIIDVKLAPNAKSEGAVKTGINMPFKATGTWANPKIRPNISGLIDNVLKNPKDAEQDLKNLKEVGKTLEDSFKGEKDAVKKVIENSGSLKDLIKSF